MKTRDEEIMADMKDIWRRGGNRAQALDTYITEMRLRSEQDVEAAQEYMRQLISGEWQPEPE